MAFKSYLGRTDLPRGLRNNNPGNLVITPINWVGEVPSSQNTDGHFEQFKELRYGIRAKMRDIINDVNKGKNTVKLLIEEFAPSFENNTPAYINTVLKLTGLSLNSKIILTKEGLISLCKAISFVENGSAYTNYITDKDYQDAIDILGISLPSSKKKV